MSEVGCQLNPDVFGDGEISQDHHAAAIGSADCELSIEKPTRWRVVVLTSPH